MLNFKDNLNQIYEIRDEGTKTQYFFVGKNSEFSPPKALDNYTVKLIKHLSWNGYNNDNKEKKVSFVDRYYPYHCFGPI